MKMQIKAWSRLNKKAVKGNLVFLIDLSMIMMITEDKVVNKEEPKTFNEASNNTDME